MDSVIGIDIGGTKTAVGLVAADGSISGANHAPTPAHDGQAVVEQAIELARPLLTQHPRAVGIGTAGLVNVETGCIHFGNGNIKDWTGIELAPRISAALGLPAAADNDVNAMAYAEMRIGAGRGFDHALCVTVGTGVGGCIIIDGRPWHGANWAGGELGHLVADVDCPGEADGMVPGALERLTAGPALERIYAARPDTGDDAPDLRDIARRASGGEAAAREVIAQGATRLGQCLGGLLAVLDPNVLVIGGGVPGIGPLWWEPLEAAFRNHPVPNVRHIELRPAELGVDAVLVGAALLMRDQGEAK